MRQDGCLELKITPRRLSQSRDAVTPHWFSAQVPGHLREVSISGNELAKPYYQTTCNLDYNAESRKPSDTPGPQTGMWAPTSATTKPRLGNRGQQGKDSTQNLNSGRHTGSTGSTNEARFKRQAAGFVLDSVGRKQTNVQQVLRNSVHLSQLVLDRCGETRNRPSQRHSTRCQCKIALCQMPDARGLQVVLTCSFPSTCFVPTSATFCLPPTFFNATRPSWTRRCIQGEGV